MPLSSRVAPRGVSRLAPHLALRRAPRPRTWLVRVAVARVVAVALAALLALAALPWPSLAAEATVLITSTYQPATLAVAPGTSVTWLNQSGVRHRVRTTAGPVEFDSGNLEAGQSFTVTLTALGTYDYLNDRDREDAAYRGRIEVTNQPLPTPSPGLTPPPDGSGGGTGGGGTAGGGTGGGGTTATPPPSTASVGMAGRVFSPTTVTIAPGGTVTWRNNDDRAHTVTSTSQAFDSGTMQAGASYQRTFPSAGTFPYLCIFHPDMVGTVIVAAAGATAPPPAPTPTPIGGGTGGDGTSGTGGTGDATGGTGGAGTTGGSTGGSTGGGGSTGPVSASIVDLAFSPSSIEVAAGTSVTWRNQGIAPHTVTDRAGSFDSGILASGASWSHTFRQTGTFQIWCVVHPEMNGQVVVRAATSGGGTSGSAGSGTVGDGDGAPAAPGGPGDPGASLAPDLGAGAGAGVTGGSGSAGTGTGGTGAGSGAGETEGGAPGAEGLAASRGSAGVGLIGIPLTVLLSGAGMVLFVRTINGSIRPARQALQPNGGPGVETGGSGQPRP